MLLKGDCQSTPGKQMAYCEVVMVKIGRASEQSQQVSEAHLPDNGQNG